MSDSKSIWNEAYLPGLVIALVCAVYDLAGLALPLLPVPFLAVALNLLLWAVKFIACIMILRSYMKRFAAADSEITNSRTFKYGVVVSLLSSLAYAAFYFAYVMYIAPDQFNQSFDMIFESYSKILDARTMEELTNFRANLPSMMFIAKLIYSFIFGLLLSAILSRNIPSRNPFANQDDNI